jgi:hypothetical protein
MFNLMVNNRTCLVIGTKSMCASKASCLTLKVNRCLPSWLVSSSSIHERIFPAIKTTVISQKPDFLVGFGAQHVFMKGRP